MFTMKSINQSHILALDLNTDKSHLMDVNDLTQTPILTFDSNLICTNSEGKTVARITTNSEGNWVIQNEIGIETTPISIEESQGVFKIEAEFCRKWLATQKTMV